MNYSSYVVSVYVIYRVVYFIFSFMYITLPQACVLLLGRCIYRKSISVKKILRRGQERYKKSSVRCILRI